MKIITIFAYIESLILKFNLSNVNLEFSNYKKKKSLQK